MGHYVVTTDCFYAPVRGVNWVEGLERLDLIKTFETYDDAEAYIEAHGLAKGWHFSERLDFSDLSTEQIDLGIEAGHWTERDVVLWYEDPQWRNDEERNHE